MEFGITKTVQPITFQIIPNREASPFKIIPRFLRVRLVRVHRGRVRFVATDQFHRARHGRQTHRLRPDAGLLAADDLRRVHVDRHLVSGHGVVAAQIRRGHPVVWRADDCGRRHPAHFRLTVGHRAISLLRRCFCLFCKWNWNSLFVTTREARIG